MHLENWSTIYWNWVSGWQGREAFCFFFPMGGITWGILGFLQIYSLFKHLVLIGYLKQNSVWIFSPWNVGLQIHEIQATLSRQINHMALGLFPCWHQLSWHNYSRMGICSLFSMTLHAGFLKCTLGLPVKQGFARVSSKKSKSPKTTAWKKNQINVLCLLRLWFCRMF